MPSNRRNPKTQEKIAVPAKYRIAFSTSATLKSALPKVPGS